MNKLKYKLTGWLVTLAIVLGGQALPRYVDALSVVDDANVQQLPPTGLADPQIWTRWHPTQYALAEDEQAIWIGAAGGVIRWDKATKSHRRYTTIDGLPHHNVYAVVIDGTGNRWFGGDGGLSRLDGNHHWSHFTTANSGIYSNLVSAIAIGTDNTLWVSHALPDGKVSRLDPDGSWRWFPNRSVAVVTDYNRIKPMRNSNRLWAVLGDEVWVDYLVYNGDRWLDRTPAGSTTPPQATATTSAALWVLDSGVLRKWSDGSWSPVTLPPPVEQVLWGTLSAGSDDTVWAGGLRSGAFGLADFFLGQISPSPNFPLLTYPDPVTAILPTTNGAWAVGPSWLVQPDRQLYFFSDLPTYAQIDDILLDAEGALWLYSKSKVGQANLALQTLADQHTPQLADDRWSVTQLTGNRWDNLTALTRAPGGDLWMAWSTPAKGLPLPADKPLWRRHQGVWLAYTWPFAWPPEKPIYATDIFAQDDSHLWFAYQAGVLALDDRGTPADLTDDRWTDYPIALGEFRTTLDVNTHNPLQAAVAVDGLGRLWRADSTGLYRYEGSKWQRQMEGDFCDLMPASDGTLLAQVNLCDQYNAQVYTDATGTILLDDFAKEHFDQVRSATRPNRLWAVAPDGAVWYVTPDYSGGISDPKLYRRTATELTKYAIPFPMEEIRNIEVDTDNRVWVATGSGLWRMAAQPDFRVAVAGATWLVAPGSSRRATIAVERLGGHTEPVTLQLRDLPVGVTAQLTPNPVPAGVSVTVILTAATDTPLGQRPVTLGGADGNITRTVPLEIAVVAQVVDHYLPVIGNEHGSGQ